MCGINGFLSNSSLPADGQALVAAMNNSLRHRGPDDSGYWSSPDRSLHLGHARLSIIDLSAAGHQPMTEPSGNAIVFNGEIYNYRELQKDAGPEPLHSGSDTEVILRLYQQYGADCVHRLKGMFAFALWDAGRRALFLARDPAGKKPVYYTEQGGRFAFSSEIRALLTLPWVRAELDEEALYHFLTFNFLPPPMTMFRGIRKFHPGFRMLVDAGGIRTYEEYREVRAVALPGTGEKELADATFSHLQSAVRYRMVSDVPVGAFLSGGVDSSAVVALMSRETAVPVKTYAVGFEGQPGYDERAYALKVAQQFGTDHYERVVTEREITDMVPRMADCFDEPLADATCIPIYFISEQARRSGSKVVLTGDGSDEIFAGYSSYKRYLRYYPWYHRYAALPGFLKQAAERVSARYTDGTPAGEMLHRAARRQEFFWGGARSFKESVKAEFLSPAFRERARNWNSYAIVRGYRDMFDKLPGKKDDIDWMCYLGYKMNDVNRFLYRADRMGMAHSVELRAPFLDTDLVDFALSVPGEMKIRNGEAKYILKKSLERILPHEILYRKKMGFCVPLREWAGGLMTGYIDEHLAGFCRDTGLFDFTRMQQRVQHSREGGESGVNDLWTVYFLIAWFKRWMNV